MSQWLAEVEWDFSDFVAANRLDSIHPYPAKFISAIPGTLLDVLSLPPDTVVLDPFCGSGTTLVECQRRGIPSAGIDLNPIACLIARVKTSPKPKGLRQAISQTVECAKLTRETKIPLIPRLDHWFNNEAQIALAALSNAIEQSDSVFQDVL